jgi:hypothetical protein
MSSTKRFALSSAAICIALVAFLASTSSAYATSLPGITPEGVPVFTNSVKVRLNKSGRLRAFSNGQGKDFTLWDGSTLRSGFGIFDLRTTVDANGKTTGGTVQIKGKGSDFGIFDEMIMLMTADLTTSNLTSSRSLWGFNTTNIWCAPELQLNCTTRESVYLTLNNLFTGDFTDNFSSSATATTTVPIPAAAWLFGSALGLLGWVRRRANTTA